MSFSLGDFSALSVRILDQALASVKVDLLTWTSIIDLKGAAKIELLFIVDFPMKNGDFPLLC